MLYSSQYFISHNILYISIPAEIVLTLSLQAVDSSSISSSQLLLFLSSLFFPILVYSILLFFIIFCQLNLPYLLAMTSLFSIDRR